MQREMRDSLKVGALPLGRAHPRSVRIREGDGVARGKEEESKESE